MLQIVMMQENQQKSSPDTAGKFKINIQNKTSTNNGDSFDPQLAFTNRFRLWRISFKLSCPCIHVIQTLHPIYSSHSSHGGWDDDRCDPIAPAHTKTYQIF